MKQVFLVHGALEPADGNISGMRTIGDKIKAVCPDATIHHYTQQDFDAINIDPSMGKIVIVARSWGGSSSLRWASRNPDVVIDLCVFFDPVCNFFKKPRFWPCVGFPRFNNIKFVQSYCESESLLKGSFMVDDTVFATDEHGIKHRETSWYRETVLPNDPKTTGFQEFLSHFTISQTEWIVYEAVNRIASV